MYVFNVFLRFFKIMTFYVFLSCCTRFPEQWDGAKPWGLGDEVDPPEAEEFQK